MGQKALRCWCMIASMTLWVGCATGLQESNFKSLDDLLVESPAATETDDAEDPIVLSDLLRGIEEELTKVSPIDDADKAFEAAQLEFFKDVRSQLEQPDESLKSVIDDIVIQAKSRENSETLALELLVAQRRNRTTVDGQATPMPDELNDHTVGVLVQSIKAYQASLDVHANNLANFYTDGFKRSRCVFEEQFLPEDETSSSITNLIGDGVRVSTIELDLAQGKMQKTGNRFDVAIEGSGFFQFKNDEGEMYYGRIGNFSVNTNSAIVLGAASRGLQLEPRIDIPPDATNIMFMPNGGVLVRQPGQLQMVNVGQMQLARFVNPDGLKRVDGNLFVETEESGRPMLGSPGDGGLGNIYQGGLESSNVELLDEAVEIVTTMKTLRLLRQLLKLPE